MLIYSREFFSQNWKKLVKKILLIALTLILQACATDGNAPQNEKLQANSLQIRARFIGEKEYMNKVFASKCSGG